jgi:hypothetical protein
MDGLVPAREGHVNKASASMRRDITADLGATLSVSMRDVLNSNIILLCQIREGWDDLPQWAAFFFDLGASLVRRQTGNERVVACVTAPTRGYAAALAATGAVLAAYASDPVAPDVERHFSFLTTLPAGSLVTFVSGKHFVTAPLLGSEKLDDVPHLKIRYDGTYYRRWDRCWDIQPATNMADAGVRKRPLTNYIDPFTTSILLHTNGAAEAFIFSTRLDCLLVGAIDSLHSEITGQDFATQTKERIRTSAPASLRPGSLSLILRCRKFLPPGEHYRADVLAAQGQTVPDHLLGKVPRLVVFDGAQGFLRWRDQWMNSSWLIVFDRTDRATDLGVEASTKERARRTGDLDLLDEINLPDGIELIAYRDRRSHP